MATPTSPSSAVSKVQPAGTVWRTPEGEPVSCVEKIKVLNENLAELRDMAQDALEDAVLMGCDEAQFRRVVRALLDGLVNPYKKS